MENKNNIQDTDFWEVGREFYEELIGEDFKEIFEKLMYQYCEKYEMSSNDTLFFQLILKERLELGAVVGRMKYLRDIKNYKNEKTSIN